ncbi:MAG: rod shape-determining protein MreD [Thermoanaerobaculia bacterium]|nr:rod shape-determining protein MreD [Thermoanaerobaculia bacterium]
MLGLFLAALLQVVVQRIGSVFDVEVMAGSIDLLLVIVVWIALSSGSVGGQVVGMLAGFLSDGLMGGTFGLYAIADTLVGYLAAVLRQRVVLQRSVLVLMFAAAAAAQVLIVMSLNFLFVGGSEPPSWIAVGSRIVTTAALGGALLAIEGRTRSEWGLWQRRRRSRLRLK